MWLTALTLVAASLYTETDGAGAGREPSVRLVTVGRRTPRPQHRHTYISDLVDTLSYKPHGDLDLISVGQYFDI